LSVLGAPLQIREVQLRKAVAVEILFLGRAP